MNLEQYRKHNIENIFVENIDSFVHDEKSMVVKAGKFINAFCSMNN